MAAVAQRRTLRYDFGSSGGLEAVIRLRKSAKTLAFAAGVLGFVWSAPAWCQAGATPSQSRQDAAAGASKQGVVETQWNLLELNGSTANIPATEGQVYIYLQQERDKLSGSDGCNRFFGSYDLSGSSLEFHSVVQTLMACRGNGFTDRGAEFLDALKLVSSYQISDNVLELKVDGRVLARFEARKK
jgi:heat shock protein HslJ